MQIYRNGTIEAADGILLRERQVGPSWIVVGGSQPAPHSRWIPPNVGGLLTQTAGSILQFQAALGVPPPVVLVLSLVRVAGYKIYDNNPMPIASGRLIPFANAQASI